MINRLFIVWGMFLFILAACENEEYKYQDTPRIWLSGDVSQGAVKDSVLFCFKLYENRLQEYDLHVVAHIMGNAFPGDREFHLEVVEEKTNVTTADYELGEMVVPAGKFQGTVNVRVKKKVSGLDLTKSIARLTLRVVPDENFEIGEVETAEFKVLWCDFLTKPASWGVIAYYLGPFSQARYKFIIDNSGMTDFNSLNGNYNKIISFQSQMKKALRDYNADPANMGREEGWPYLNDDGVTPLEIGVGLKI